LELTRKEKMMIKLTKTQKEMIINNAPIGADSYDTSKDPERGGAFYYRTECVVAEYWCDPLYVFRQCLNGRKWREKNLRKLADLREELNKEYEREELAPKLVTLINIFKAEFPHGFDEIGGFTREDFYNEICDLSLIAGRSKWQAYSLTKKKMFEPVKKTIVDAVNACKCVWPFKITDKGFIDGTAVTRHEFNQCVSEMTGDKQEHQEWLTALNDMREYELNEAYWDVAPPAGCKFLIKTMGKWKEAVSLGNLVLKTDNSAFCGVDYCIVGEHVVYRSYDRPLRKIEAVKNKKIPASCNNIEQKAAELFEIAYGYSYNAATLIDKAAFKHLAEALEK
jgi:hypothetical protein